MSKKLIQAKTKAPELPRVRFMRKAPPGSTPAFIDVTLQVASVVVESLENGTDACELVRLDEKGDQVWRTLHQSLQEARWQARHEYELEEKDWTNC